MARNKYPEITVNKILEVSRRLFLQKGYEQTTIQDIVDELGGLTKGAVYHHFKSKEDIMDALGSQMFFDDNPFDLVNKDSSLNGLEKIKKLILLSFANSDRKTISIQSIPLLKNPRFLAEHIESSNNILAPMLKEVIDEGIRDGSIKVDNSRELSQIFILLTNIWLVPSIFPATKDEIRAKFSFLQKLFDGIGLPVFDSMVMEVCDQYCEDICQ